MANHACEVLTCSPLPTWPIRRFREPGCFFQVFLCPASTFPLAEGRFRGSRVRFSRFLLPLLLRTFSIDLPRQERTIEVTYRRLCPFFPGICDYRCDVPSTYRAWRVHRFTLEHVCSYGIAIKQSSPLEIILKFPMQNYVMISCC